MVRLRFLILLQFQVISLFTVNVGSQNNQISLSNDLDRDRHLRVAHSHAVSSDYGMCDFRGRSMPAHVRAMFAGLAGGLAGSSVSFLLHPLDTLKTISQTAEGRAFPNFVSAGRNIIMQKGIYAGLYAGARTAAFGSFFSSALYFGTYESVRGSWSIALPPSLKPVASSLAAITGNAASSLLFVPKEVLKQRCQVARPSLLCRARTPYMEGLRLRRGGFEQIGQLGRGQSAMNLLAQVPSPPPPPSLSPKLTIPSTPPREPRAVEVDSRSTAHPQ